MPPSAADRLNGLPDLKKDLQQILQVVTDRHAPLSAVTDALARDPATAAHVLSTANSGFIAAHQAVGTVDDATLKLGLSRVRILATATVLATRLNPGTCPSFDTAGYWHQAISVALCVSKLANHVTVEVPHANIYLSGLLHDVGLLVNARAFPEAMDSVLKAHAADAVPGLSWRQIQALGFDHHTAGAHALRGWEIHAGAPEVAEHHANASYEGPGARLVALVRLCRNWYLNGYEGQPMGVPLGDAGAKLSNIGLSCQREARQVETAAAQLAGLVGPPAAD